VQRHQTFRVLPAEKEFGSSAPFFSVFHSLSKSGRSSANGGSEDRWVVMIQGIQKLMAEEPNVEMTGAARLHRAASSDRRERGRSPGYAYT